MGTHSSLAPSAHHWIGKQPVEEEDRLGDPCDLKPIGEPTDESQHVTAAEF